MRGRLGPHLDVQYHSAAPPDDAKSEHFAASASRVLFFGRRPRAGGVDGPSRIGMARPCIATYRDPRGSRPTPRARMRSLNYNHLWYFWMVAREGSIAAATVKLGVYAAGRQQPDRAAGALAGHQALRKERARPCAHPRRRHAVRLRGRDVRPRHRGAGDAGARRAGRPAPGRGRGRGRAARADAPAAGARHPDGAPRAAEGAPRPPRPAHGGAGRARGGPGAVHGAASRGVGRARAAARPGRVRPRVAGGARRWRASWRPAFPGRWTAVPFILPPSGAPLRRILDSWMQAQGAAPAVVAEMDELGGGAAAGAVRRGGGAVPAAAEEELRQPYWLEVVGHAHDAVQPFYALTAERRPRHPAVWPSWSPRGRIPSGRDGPDRPAVMPVEGEGAASTANSARCAGPLTPPSPANCAGEGETSPSGGTLRCRLPTCSFSLPPRSLPPCGGGSGRGALRPAAPYPASTRSAYFRPFRLRR